MRHRLDPDPIGKQSDGEDRSEPSRRQVLQTAAGLVGTALAPDPATAAPIQERATPLARSHGILTPPALHFERHKGDVPALERQHHRLIVHGRVARPRTYGMAELECLPALTRFWFIECAANRPSVGDALTSTAEWTGVPLSALLRAAGVGHGAAWLIAEGADAGRISCHVPLGKAWRDGLLAYGQNGTALRPAQGYPVRLILPGWQGWTHIKWLHRLEITERSPASPTAREPVMEANSVITFPAGAMRLPGPGFYEIAGLAWSGRGRVAAVEVSCDGGGSWTPATLQEPVLPVCHTRFRCPWHWDGRPAVLQSRCRDETGRSQPGGGARNAVLSWQVSGDGVVQNAGAASGSSARVT